MIDFLLKSNKHTSQLCVYRTLRIKHDELRRLCSLPLASQALLQHSSGLLDGSMLSFYPTDSERLTVCIRSQNYANAHACMDAVEQSLQSTVQVSFAER